MRICRKCKIEKPETEFRKDKKGKGGLSARCRICRNKQDKEWRISNPEKKKLSDKRWLENNRERARKTAREWERRNPERVKGYHTRYCLKNREILREKSRECRRLFPEKEAAKAKRYYLKNKDAMRERLKRWRKNNPEKEKAQAKRRDSKRMESPQWRIRIAIRSGMHASLKKGKAGRSWESLVGYTLKDLMEHLEKQFEPGMSWDNYGKWHIDHIKPISLFNFTSPEDKEFKECWALKNLRPLEGSVNIRKGNQY